MQNEQKAEAAVLIRDLIFETKIKSTGSALGVAVRVVRSPMELGALLEIAPVRLVIVDLNSAGDLVFDAIRAAKQNVGVRVIAFVSHVDAELAERARQAGADEVMPRSRFSANLPAILTAVQEINSRSTNPQ